MAKNQGSGQSLSPLAENIFPYIYLYYMLDSVARYHCMQFQGKLINQTWENSKKASFGPDFGPVCANLGSHFFSLKNLTSSVTRYYGQLLSCTISEKS